MQRLQGMRRADVLSFRPLLLAIACASVAAAACQRNDLDRGAVTTTTSARPDSTATTSRTIDNTGFVDNAGRTSEMTNRTTASGMRATETSSERPTGTPGSGTPIPGQGTPARATEEGQPPPRARSGAAPASGPLVPTSGPPVLDDDVARLARARCDRETACNRIGPGRAYESQGDCMMQQRGRSQRDLSAAACQNGIDRTQLALCLGETRKLACDATDELANVGMCRPTEICGI